MAKYDDMTFGRAFAAARKDKGAGGTFTWKGNSYSTNRADDSAGSSSGSRGSSDVESRASAAIDRAVGTRPKARPERSGGAAPTTRPKARPTATAPTSSGVSTPAVTTSELPPSGQRASNSGSSTSGTVKGVTRAVWDGMSRRERQEAGLPTSVAGWAIAARRGNQRADNPNASTRSRPGGSAARGLAKGGMAKKGYNKGGVVKANCGASMKPTQKSSRRK